MTILSKNGEFRLPGQQSPFQSSALFVIPAGSKAEDQQHHSRSAQRDSHRKGFGAFTHRIHKHRKDAPRVQQQVEHPQHSLAASAQLLVWNPWYSSAKNHTNARMAENRNRTLPWAI